MRAFVESSALTKAYVEEPGSERVERILDRFSRDGELYVSALVQVEVVSAFAKKYRRGRLGRSERGQAYTAFMSDYPDAFNIIRPSKLVLQGGAELLHRVTSRQLKASDAIQLASAEYLIDEVLPDDASATFVCSDKRLGERARERQIWTYNPQTQPLEKLPDQRSLFD